MTLFTRFSILVGALLLVSLVACDDPSGVGLDLIDEEGGVPSTSAYTLDLETFREAAISGGTANVLIGQFADPVLDQQIRAHGHINFFPADADDFEEGDEIEGATLQITPTVAYGDTTGTVRLALREIVAEWEAIRTASDTSLNVSEVIDEFSVDIGGGQMQFELPNEWVEQRSEVLRDTALVDHFFGFQLETLSGNSILSAPGSSTSLTLRTSGESDVSLPATPEFALTTVEATEPTLSNRRVLQHVTGYGVRSVVPIGDSLADHSVNRASLELPVDTSALAGDLSIVRQEPDRLFVELSTGAHSSFVRLTRSLENPATFTSQEDDATVRQFFQQTLREAATIDSVYVQIYPNQHFRSIVPEGAIPDVFQLQLNTIPIYPANVPDCPYQQCTPRILLTTTPLD